MPHGMVTSRMGRMSPSVNEWLEPLWLPSGATTVMAYCSASAAARTLMPFALMPSSLVRRMRIDVLLLVLLMAAPSQNSYVVPFLRATVSVTYP
jgi:hypothetical protein